MNTRKFLGVSILSAALLLASAIPGLAKNSCRLALHRDAVLSGTTLPAGQYIVEWENHSPKATVQFTRGHKLILSTESTIEDRGKKYQSSMVVYSPTPGGTMVINEIRVAGSSQVLVFHQAE